MSYLTEDKLVIFGSAGAIGSNMVQAALTMGLTPNIAMVDPYDKGNEGAAEEIGRGIVHLDQDVNQSEPGEALLHFGVESEVNERRAGKQQPGRGHASSPGQNERARGQEQYQRRGRRPREQSKPDRRDAGGLCRQGRRSAHR